MSMLHNTMRGSSQVPMMVDTTKGTDSNEGANVCSMSDIEAIIR
jgi:hypothetical protein